MEEIDAAGHSVKYTFDKDGATTATTDQEGVQTLLTLDERAKVVEVKVPHTTDDDRVTTYEYDQGDRKSVV